MLTASRAICLAKTFKHMREKCGLDTGSVIVNTDTYTGVSAVEEVNVDETSSVREFDRVCEQIPDDLLQSLRVAFSEPR